MVRIFNKKVRRWLLAHDIPPTPWEGVFNRTCHLGGAQERLYEGGRGGVKRKKKKFDRPLQPVALEDRKDELNIIPMSLCVRT